MSLPGRYGTAEAIRKGLAFLLLLAVAALARPAAARDLLILAFGDSLTAGYQLAPSESFPAQLEAALRKEGRAVSVHNAGASGDTSAQGRARLEWVLKGLPRKPDVAIVALGANDMLRGQPVPPMRDNLDAIIGRLRADGIAVIVAGMQAAPNLGSAYAREYNAVFPSLAKKHGTAYYPFFLDGVAANPKFLLPDQMHPNRQGVAVMVSRMLPTVRQTLDSLPAARTAASSQRR
ncbi:MAG: arylesterase [Sphingomonadaceae bacterium]